MNSPFDEGYRAYSLDREFKDNPYDENSPEHAEWRAGIWKAYEDDLDTTE